MEIWSEQQWLEALQATLPPGPAWPRDDGATLTAVLRVFARAFTRAGERIAQVPEEGIPGSADETLDEWVSEFGAGDGCSALASEAEKRAAVRSRYAGRGIRNRAFFENLAASLGYEIEITHVTPTVCGDMELGVELTAEDHRFVWQVTTASGAYDALLQCEFERLSKDYGLLLMEFT